MQRVSDELILQKLSPFVKVSVNTYKPSKKLKMPIRHKKTETVGGYRLDRILGKGKCGNVRLAWPPDSDTPVAMKLTSRAEVDSSTIERLAREMNALSELNHPHVVKIKEVVIDNISLGLVMDWASGGDVFRHLAEFGPINESKAQKWFAQLTWAVDEMHTISYLHRDIKPENLLIDANDNLVLTDFEMCESFRQQGFPFVLSVCGSPTYCPPEAMLSTRSFDACKADVWAMGVSLYTMVAGYLPFDDREFFGHTKSEIMQLYKHINETPLKVPDTFSPQLTNLLNGLLAKNPDERLSLADVKKHPWLEDHMNLWLCPGLSDNSSNQSYRSTRFGSFPSTSSLQTLNDKMADCKKQVRGPIIWDPNAGFDLPRER